MPVKLIIIGISMPIDEPNFKWLQSEWNEVLSENLKPEIHL